MANEKGKDHESKPKNNPWHGDPKLAFSGALLILGFISIGAVFVSFSSNYFNSQRTSDDFSSPSSPSTSPPPPIERAPPYLTERPHFETPNLERAPTYHGEENLTTNENHISASPTPPSITILSTLLIILFLGGIIITFVGTIRYMYLKIKKKPAHVRFFFLFAGLLFLGGLITLFGLGFVTMAMSPTPPSITILSTLLIILFLGGIIITFVGTIRYMYLKIKKKPAHVRFFFLFAGLLFLGGLITLFGLGFGAMGVLLIVGLSSIVIGAILYIKRKRSQLSYIDFK